MAFCVALLAHVIYVGLIFGRLMTQFLTIMPTCALNEILLSLCDIFTMSHSTTATRSAMDSSDSYQRTTTTKVATKYRAAPLDRQNTLSHPPRLASLASTTTG